MSISTMWQPAVSGRVRLLWPALGPIFVALAYYLAAEAAFAIGTLTQQFAPFWPPNVVLLCAFLSAPRRQWPLFIVAAFPAHVLAELGVAMPLQQLVMAFLCNVSVALLNAIALSWLLRGPAWLGTLRNALLYVAFAVVVNPAVVALAAGFEPTLGDGDPSLYWHFWQRWYLSNALGNLTLAPLFLAWFRDDFRLPLTRSTRRRALETSLLAIGLIVSCALAFDIPLTRSTEKFIPALLYLPVPLILAAAVRFGSKGASGAILIVTVEVLLLAMQGDAPFAGNGKGNGVLAVQMFLAVIATPAILLAALVEELQRTNDRLSAVLDGISDCYFTLDREGRITGVNGQGAAWWSAGSPEELIGRYYADVTREGGAPPFWASRAAQRRMPLREEFCSSNGRWADIRAYPSPTGGLNIFYHDITERRAAEESARATQTLLQSSLDALTLRLAILDQTGRIVAVNAAWRRTAEALTRFGEDYAVGANYIEQCGRGRPHQQRVAAGLRRVLCGEVSEFRCEFASRAAEGRWIQLRATRFGESNDLRLVIACEDVTEVKVAEAGLRSLAGKLLRLQDEERRRIARELHDSTAQNLLGATLGIGQALRLAPRLNSSARAALDESRSLIEQSQREIRTVSYLLHPPMLDEAGLPAALRWFCDGFAKRTEIVVDLDVGSDLEQLPTDVEAVLFRVAQEALSNVHRHSGASKVRVILRRNLTEVAGLQIELRVEDNGNGMPTELAQLVNSGKRLDDLQNIGIGLAGMRERLLQIAGALEIRSSPGGTLVRAAVPFSQALGTPVRDRIDTAVVSAPGIVKAAERGVGQDIARS